MECTTLASHRNNNFQPPTFAQTAGQSRRMRDSETQEKEARPFQYGEFECHMFTITSRERNNITLYKVKIEKNIR